MENKGFKLAELELKESTALQEFEKNLKTEMGKDIVLIAWEKKRH